MEQIYKNFTPQIITAGKTYNAEQAIAENLVLTQQVRTQDDAVFLSMTLENRSPSDIHLDKFNWHRKKDCRDFLASAGIQLYLEGWQMATPCGVRKIGDCDYRFDPWYIDFAVADPSDYSPLANHFRAENMMMFHDEMHQKTLLVGFVTTGNQFGHFKTVLCDKGVESLDIRSSCDGMLIEPGESVHSETLVFLWGNDGYELQCRYADILGFNMKARTHRDPPVGWCSWYYYFSDVTQKDIEENVSYLAQHKETLPLRYIQLDDGYQSTLGDWLICNEKFPDGLSAVAKNIRDHGFIPALWVAPFLVEEKATIFKEHPEWMIHDENGEVILHYPWRTGSAAVLDGTNPHVQDHLRLLFQQIRALGFDYVKLDFLVTASTVRNGMLHDPKATRAQALRRGLEAIREGFGEDGFILGCTVPFGSAIGLVDGERIASDIAPYWAPDHPYFDEAPTMPNCARNVLRHLYMDKRLWNNDPDTLLVRDDQTALTENEVMLWREIIRLTGGMLLLGDNFLTLSESRQKLVEQILREPHAYKSKPVDFWHSVPSIVHSVHQATGTQYRARFNFSDYPANIAGLTLGAHSCLTEKFPNQS